MKYNSSIDEEKKNSLVELEYNECLRKAAEKCIGLSNKRFILEEKIKLIEIIRENVLAGNFEENLSKIYNEVAPLN